MHASGPAIDWGRPWLSDWRRPGQEVARQWMRGTPLHDALNAQAPGSPRFVSHEQLPPGQHYERYVFETGRCPVRNNLHDFFNGLAWLRFPHTKAALNRLHAEHLKDAVAPAGTRGALRDALTVFDENAALLLDAPAPLRQALAARQWQRAFVELRAQWRNVRVVLFGHSLLEKLEQPRKPITAHVYAPLLTGMALDQELSESVEFQALRFDRPLFVPLPVLGVPGWWPANEDPRFYADDAVFRPPALISKGQALTFASLPFSEVEQGDI